MDVVVIFVSLHLQALFGVIQVLRNVMGGVGFPRKKRYKGVRFNVISVTRVGGGQIPRKKALYNT